MSAGTLSKVVVGTVCLVFCLTLALQMQGCARTTTPLPEKTSDAASSDTFKDSSSSLINCPECTVFTGGTLFDGEKFREGTLVIKGNKIQSVLTGPVSIQAGTIVSIKGKTLLPGLLDLHVHTLTSGGPYGFTPSESQAANHFKTFLRAGVTSIFDHGSPSRLIFAFRDRIRAGKILGPNLFAVGPLVTTSGGHPCNTGSPVGDFCLLLDNVADVQQLGKRLFPNKPDMVKIVIEHTAEPGNQPRMSKETLKAATTSIQKQGISVVAFVSTPKDIDYALDAGIRIFGNIPTKGLLSQSLLQRLVKEKAILIPTLAVTEHLYLLSQGQYPLGQRNLQKDVAAQVLASLKNPDNLKGLRTSNYKADIKKSREISIANFKACLKAGVVLVAGSDAGNPGTFHGPGLHEEILLFQKLGMTSAQALQAATMTAARTLNLKDRGVLASGAVADLVIVDGDLRKDLPSIRNVERVYLAGVDVQRDTLGLDRKTSVIQTAVTNQDQGATCLFPAECKPTLVCDPYNFLCTKSCDPKKPTDCSKKTYCYQAAPQDTKGLCMSGTGCNPLQQACPNNAACIWLGNETTTCWYAGKGKDGASCSVSEFCARGYQCNYNTGKCYKLCNPKDPTSISCDKPGQTCSDLSQLAGFNIGGCF